MRQIHILVLVLYLVISNQTYGQNRGINRENYQVRITKTDIDITVDGLLNEDFWTYSDLVTDFHRVLPTDTGFAIAQTEIRMAYSETHLFIGVVCHDPSPGKRPVESLRRDFTFGKNDNFIVFIDTYNDQTNGFAFGISPAGAQWDGIQANGGKVNLDWDTKWRSSTKNYADKWTAEFAIPFRSLRYNGGAPEWGINFSRQDLKTGEKSSWAPMPRQFATATLAFTGSLIWDKPLPGSGPRFSLIPYVSAQGTQVKSESNMIRRRIKAGADAKVILSTAMNLDLTINPDYSQVEVDQQQTNLDRFELFFPEKRHFFLENSDIFANLGDDKLRPFFSRRIGLDVPVLAGARLSGKLGDDWRIGIMDMQTNRMSNIPATNYSVAALQRKIFSRSSISGFLINKQIIHNNKDSSSGENNFNRVAGAEFNLASKDNKWIGKTFFHHSFDPGKTENSHIVAANITYADQYFSASVNQALVGENFNAEVGYIRRKGYYEMNPGVKYHFFPKNSRIAKHGPALEADLFLDMDVTMTDRDIQLLYRIDWLNKSALEAEIRNSFVELQFPFNPIHINDEYLDEGDSFSWNEYAITYNSDVRKPFNYQIKGRYGGYFNGERMSIDTEIFYRIQPYSSLAIVSSYNRLNLPEPFASPRFILIGPRLDITFTNKIFFTSLVQYNNQINNLNLNLRFQWRFAPASDLYIVYTENTNYIYDKNEKLKGLAVKLSYWIN